MNDIEVRFPGLLDAELNESERLRPLSASLTLNLYGSSEATITLPEDAPYIRIHDWVSLYTQNGFAGIFRVTNISRNFKRNLELTLLHGIDILSDSVWSGQEKFSGNMTQFLTAALNHQTHLVNGVKPWVLGVCEDSSTTFTDKEMNYDRLSTLLEGLIEEGGDYYYEYNMSTFPWTLNVRRKSSVVWSEFRLSRNVTTANVTYNDADLCTRLIVSVNNKTTEERGDYSVPSETVYPDQSAHGLIPDSSKAPGSTAEVTSNETTIKTYDSESGQRNWGIVVKTADIDLAEIRQTWPSVDAWAANFMGLRSQPSVQIQIDGEELAQLSGDNWDELALGRNCRVCLPTYSPGYFNERVVSVTYPDLFSRPSHVTVSLANALPKFSESITRIADKADSAASSARSAGRYAASAEELTQWSQIVEYYGEALDGTGVMTLYRSGIEMDASGGVKIYSLTQGAQSLYAGIQVTSSEIASEIRRAQEAESSIRQTADSIATRVSTAEGKVSTLEQTATSLTTRIGTAEGNISTLQQTADSLTSRIETAEGKYSLIEQTATKVGMVVVTQTAQDGTTSNKINVSGIVTAINNDNTTETVIQANKIVLNSNQTQISISDIFSASSTVKAPAVHTAALYADSITTAAYGSGTSPDTEGSTVTMGTHLLSMQRGTGNNSLSVQFLGNGDADLDHYHVLTISEITTGNDAGKMQVKLGNPTRNVADATQNFKIADTAYYKSHVGIKTTGSWQWDDEEEKYYRTIAPNDGQSETIDLPTFTTSVGSFNSQHKATILFKGPNNHTVASAIADASGLYSEAQNSVNVSGPTWSAVDSSNPYTRTATFKPSIGTGTSADLVLSGAWSYAGNAISASAKYVVSGNSTEAFSTTASLLKEYNQNNANVLVYLGDGPDRKWAQTIVTVTPGTATPETPQHTGDGVYTLSAAGTVTIDGTVYNLTAGSDTFTATEAINYGRTLVSLNAPTVNQITGQLTASRSFTVAMSGSGTSPEPSKTVYTKLELSGSKVQLKWRSNPNASYSNAVAEYDVSSLVTARTATGLDSVTLTADDIGANGASGSETGTRGRTAQTISKLTTVTYDDGNTTANIPVVVNAKAIYDQGCYDGWDKAAVKFIYPSIQGSNAYIIISGPDQNTYNGSIGPTYYLDSGTESGTVYAYLRYNNSTQGNIVAKKSISAAVTQREGTGLSDTITLSASDTGTFTKYTVLEYDDDSDTSNFPVRINASAVYRAGQNSVEISTATLSNVVYNSSARSATAVLTVSLTNGKSKTYSDRVDVSTPYQAGLDGRSAVNTQSFRIKLTDYSGFEIDKTYAVNTKAIYDKGVEDATPVSDYPYQAKVETSRAGTGGSVNLRASSSTSASILTAIPNGATINTKVELGTTPNESGAWYNADWVEVQYGNFTGYVQSQFVLNTVKYWQTQPKYIYGVYSDGFTPPVEVGVKVPGRTGLVIFNLMNNKSAAMAQQGGLYEQDITGTPTNVYSSSWRAIGKTCYVCYSDGTTRSYTIEDENA